MKRNALSLSERQPVAVYAAIVGVLTAVVHVLVVTGVIPVDAEEAIAGTVDAVGALVLVVLAARAVTPNAKVAARVTTEGQVVAGDAAVPPTGNVLTPARGGDQLPVVQVPVNPALLTSTPNREAGHGQGTYLLAIGAVVFVAVLLALALAR